MKKILSILILSVSVSATNAQSISNLQIVNNGEQTASADVNTRTTEDGKDIIHVVDQGENLYRITKSYGFKIKEIMDYNGLTSDALYIGQQIRIPVKGTRGDGKATPIVKTNPVMRMPEPVSHDREVTSPKVVAPVSSTTYTEKWIFHTVMTGDDLSSIADSYQLSVDQLRAINDNIEPSQLSVGDKLKVKKEFVPYYIPSDIAKELPNPNTSSRDLPSDNAPVFEIETSDNKRLPESPAPVVAPVTTAPKVEKLVEPLMPTEANEEAGTYIVVKDDKITDKYYAYHKTLPKGSVVKLQIPNNAGYLEVKILGKLRADRTEILGLSPDCVRIIGGVKSTPKVSISY